LTRKPKSPRSKPADTETPDAAVAPEGAASEATKTPAPEDSVSESIASVDIPDAEVVAEDSQAQPERTGDEAEAATDTPEAASDDSADAPADAGTEYPAPEAVDTSPEQEPAPEPEVAPEPAAPEPPKRGAGGLILGGVIAAVLGGAAVFAVERFVLPAPGVDTSALEARLAALEGAPTPVPTEDTVTEAERAAIAEAVAPLADLSARLDALDERITRLEAIPPGSGGDPAVLNRLQSQAEAAEADRARLEADLAAAEARAAAEIAAAEDRARAAEEAATAEARAAAREAAEQRLIAAIETGAPFGDALAALSEFGVDTAALGPVAETGVPSLVALQDAYPDLAREALSESLKETVGAGAGERFMAFIQAQVGARSLTPREGDDPDAILSRAEAALANGQIAVALDELGSLPEGGQAVFADWRARAEQRLTALDALDTIRSAATEG
jgi:hypothetical protein